MSDEGGPKKSANKGKSESNPNNFRYYTKDSIKDGPRFFQIGSRNERGIDDYEKELGINCRELAGKDVLNLGSGSQLWFEQQLKDNGINARVISVSPDYAESEHRTMARSKKPENVEIYAAIGQELPFKDKSFDAVLVLHVTEHLRTQEAYEALLREIVRVLRVGGEARVYPLHEKYFPKFDPTKEISGAEITRVDGIGSIRLGDVFFGEQRCRVPLQKLIIKKTA